MSEFMRSTQATNSFRSEGRVGSRTRCTWTPADHLVLRRPLVAPRQHVDLDAELHQALRLLADDARQPALDQRRVLPGEDEDARVGDFRASGPVFGRSAGRAANRYRSGLQERCQAQIGARSRSRGAAPCGSAKASSIASACAGGAPERVVARLAAVVHERPVARLHGQQLARRPLRARGRRRQAVRDARPACRSSRRREAQARSRTAGLSHVSRLLPSPQLDSNAAGSRAGARRAPPTASAAEPPPPRRPRPPPRARSGPRPTSAPAARCRSRTRTARCPPHSARAASRPRTAARNSRACSAARARAASGS